MLNRTLPTCAILTVTISEWLFAYFRPDINIGNWLAAIAGAFILRFVLPKMPLTASFWGWFVAVLIACIFAPDVVKAGGWFGLTRSESNFALVGFLGDIAIRIVAWLFKLFTGVGNYTLEHPSEAFDQGIDKAGKLADLWIKIKAPFLDFLSTFGKKS